MPIPSRSHTAAARRRAAARHLLLRHLLLRHLLALLATGSNVAVAVAVAVAVGTMPACAEPAAAAASRTAPPTTLRVWVDAPDGTPIAGLAASDFELAIDGESRTARRATDAPSDTILIVVDPTFMLPGDLLGVRPAVERFLDTLQPDDRVLLAITGPRLDVPVRTGDGHRAVLDALDTLRESPVGLRFERERVAIQREMRRDSVRAEQSQQAELRTARINREMTARIDSYRAEADQAVERLCRQLESLLQGLSGLPGEPTLLFIGGRLPTVIAVDLFDSWRLIFGGRADALPGTIGRLENQRGTLDDLGVGGRALGDEALFEPLIQRAAVSGITVYAVQAAALRTDESDQFAERTSKGADRRLATDALRGDAPTRGLRLLAEESGGRALGGNRAGADLLSRVASDLRAGYRFVLDVDDLDDLDDVGTPRRVNIDLRRGAAPRRARVRHRPLVVAEDPDRLAMRRTLSALLFGAVGAPLEADDAESFRGVEVLPATPSGGLLSATVRIPLGALALLPDGRVHAGRLSLFAVGGSFDAGTGRVQTASVPVRIPNHELLTSLGRRAELTVDVDLPAGADRLAVSVRDDLGERFVSVLAHVGPEPLEVAPILPLDAGVADEITP